MNHAFNIDLACQYSIEKAILINNMAFWIKKNKANGINFHEGKYWTYNSARAYSEIFPYMSSQKIARILRELVKEEILLADTFNKWSADRTLWYTFSDEFRKKKFYDFLED